MAAFQRRYYAGGGTTTTLANPMGITDTSFNITSSTGWPGAAPADFIVVIDRGTASEEKILCSTESGITVTVASSGRGYDGTSAVAHNAGATVSLVGGAIDFDEANQISHLLGNGTSGYILEGGGTGALPSWVANSSGNMNTSTYDPAAIAQQVVGTTATQTLTNKTLTAPVVSSIVNTGTLTLPTSTDTLVGRATTDTLTNKTLTSPALTTPALNGVTVSGTPSASQVLTATSATAADWQTPSAGALTYASGVLGATVNLGASTMTTIMSTSSLAVGTWLVNFGVLINSNGSATAAGDQILAKLISGTATATYSGQTWVETQLGVATTSGYFFQMSMTCIVTVTVAGTLTFQGEYAGTAGGSAQTGALGTSTAYTAVKIA